MICKEIKDAVMDCLMFQIENQQGNNYQPQYKSQKLLKDMDIHIYLDKKYVLQGDKPIFHIERKFSKKKNELCHQEQKPKLTDLTVGKELTK